MGYVSHWLIFYEDILEGADLQYALGKYRFLTAILNESSKTKTL